MENFKTFNEMRNSNIHTGIELTPKQINYIRDGIDKEYLGKFNILVDDGIFYVKYFNEKWEFDRIQDLRDLIHFMYYIDKDKPDKASEIIKRNKNLDYSFANNWPIRRASFWGQTEMVELLLQDSRVDPSSWDNYSIRVSSERGHVEVVKLLLQDDRVDPSADYDFAIKGASSSGHIEVVKLLLQHKRMDHRILGHAIRMASHNGHTEIVKLLLQDGRVDPSDMINLAIKWASQRGHNEIVKLLIQHPKVRARLTEKEIEEYEKY